MKQRIAALLLGIFMLGLSHSWAQTLTVDRSDYSQAVYSFTASQPTIGTADVAGSTYSVISLTDATPSTHIGRPNLPRISQMVEIPLCEDVKVTVSDVQVRGMKPLIHPLMPVQPAPSKADREVQPFVIDSAYYATDALNCRNSASTNAKVLVTVPQGTEVTSYGYYDKGNGYIFLYAQAMVNKVLYTGFFASEYLSTSKNAPAKVLKVGSKIRIRNGAMQYGKKVGFASKVYNTVYTVSEISGNRVVFKSGSVVMGAVAKSDCIVQ